MQWPERSRREARDADNRTVWLCQQFVASDVLKSMESRHADVTPGKTLNTSGWCSGAACPQFCCHVFPTSQDDSNPAGGFC